MPQTHLQLNLGFGNILLAAAAVRNLLGLSDLGTDSLRAEVLQGVTLDGVDAQGGLGLNDGKATGDCGVLCKLYALLQAGDLGGLFAVRTEELLAAALLDDLDDAGLQLLNRRDVVGKDAHLTRLGGNVDLDGIVGLVDGLDAR